MNTNPHNLWYFIAGRNNQSRGLPSPEQSSALRQERYFLYGALILFTIIAFSAALYFIINQTQSNSSPSQPEILFGNNYVSGTSEYYYCRLLTRAKNLLRHNNIRLTYSSQPWQRPSSHRSSKLGCPKRYPRTVPITTSYTLCLNYPYRRPVNALYRYVQMLDQNANYPRRGRSRAKSTRHPQQLLRKICITSSNHGHLFN